MNKPHVLVVVIFWNGQLTSFSNRFETGIAAAAAGQTLETELTTPTRKVRWFIFPEKA